MKKDVDRYWRQWEQLLTAAAEFQGLLPGAVLIGGSAASIHPKHRFSFDADHILSNLKEDFEQVLDFLEGRDDWKTARVHPPKLILGNFQGVETGIRQLMRNRPLETVQVDIGIGKKVTVPTVPEMIRTKAWMIVSRNMTRDYIDFAALVKHLGIDASVETLSDFDSFYSDIIRGEKASPAVQLIRQLADPAPGDLDQIDLSIYKGIRPPFESWDYIVGVCEKVSVGLGDQLSA